MKNSKYHIETLDTSTNVRTSSIVFIHIQTLKLNRG